MNEIANTVNELPQLEPPQASSADLIDVLADYCQMRGAKETKAEMVEKLTAMSDVQLKQFADLTVAEVAQAQVEGESRRIVVPRRQR